MLPQVLMPAWYYPICNPTSYKTTVKYSTSHCRRVPPAVKRGSGGEHCGGTTQLSPPDAASRGEAERRHRDNAVLPCGETAGSKRTGVDKRKDLQKYFDASSPPPPAYRRKYPAPGRTGRGGLGAAEAPKTNTYEQSSKKPTGKIFTGRAWREESSIIRHRAGGSWF